VYYEATKRQKKKTKKSVWYVQVHGSVFQPRIKVAMLKDHFAPSLLKARRRGDSLLKALICKASSVETLKRLGNGGDDTYPAHNRQTTKLDGALILFGTQISYFVISESGLEWVAITGFSENPLFSFTSAIAIAIAPSICAIEV
jgi:hypothetical protein